MSSVRVRPGPPQLFVGIVADLKPLALKRIVLKASGEGAALYRQHGWAPLDEPDTWMELRPQGPAER
ncbi:hypothetical protein ET495_06670 [Xylanimonas allomyrinae]|uniref:GNAT family N-acetyltransferase n=1 Tax=Xylanimonas allomyrinae TaxID=2509459 RepID=A0A4P6ERH7_9MICO|nr:hypothetical protein [Xylanimonas allomyrinae]QAY62977.1 hypothetical protein ET495_06670 [Xylanimonas allomyrinae]